MMCVRLFQRWLLLVAFLVLAAAASAGVENAKITASDAMAGVRFGSTVSILGETALVGSHGGLSRYSVAISGNTALVGADADDDRGESAGAAYVFRFDGSNWVEEAKLTASDGDEDDSFGYSVAISGDTALISGVGDEDTPDSKAAAYFFRFDGSNWVEEATLTASDSNNEDCFGCEISFSGTTAFIGALDDDDDGFSSGSVYVFSVPEPSRAALGLLSLVVLASLRRRRLGEH